MILTDHFPFLLYFLLSYSKDISWNIASCWVQNTVSRFSNSSPKGGTGWWLDWLTKATEHCGSSWNRSLKAAQGLRVSANVSLSIWKVPQLPECSLIWLGHYILYCINTRLCLSNKSSYLPTLTSVTFSNWEYPFGTQMFYLCTIQILHTNSLYNIYSPYNSSWLLCALLN